MTETWNVTFIITRKKGDEAPRTQTFQLTVDPDEYVLDGIERVWAFHDRSLVFRHACHHSTCGACGMRVNGVEKLTCITPIREVTQDGGVVRVEPLRNYPVVSDVVVDMAEFYRNMELVKARSVLPSEQAGQVEYQRKPQPAVGSEAGEPYMRLSDCIECGLCMSACPILATTPSYLGPAVLAGAQQQDIRCDASLLSLVDSEDGVWRCHSAFECTAVCPSHVEPGWRIMDLRKQVIQERFRRVFKPGSAPAVEVAK